VTSLTDEITFILERVDDVVVAAAEVYTGAMIALVPSDADVKRLSVPGGEPTEQMHTTLVYLGDADDISPNAKRKLISRLRALATDALKPVEAEGFAVSVFNPPGHTKDDGKDRDSCIVLGLSGDQLAQTHTLVCNAVSQLQKTLKGLSIPDQHRPWIPHVTLVYTDDVGRVATLTDRTGPITFDRLRLAFAGEVVDIPLVS
jgi:2'-5' RNA ligase